MESSNEVKDNSLVFSTHGCVISAFPKDTKCWKNVWNEKVEILSITIDCGTIKDTEEPPMVVISTLWFDVLPVVKGCWVYYLVTPDSDFHTY